MREAASMFWRHFPFVSLLFLSHMEADAQIFFEAPAQSAVSKSTTVLNEEERCKRVIELAGLALEQGELEISLNAVKRGLRSGSVSSVENATQPNVVTLGARLPSGQVRNMKSPPISTAEKLSLDLLKLVDSWKSHKVSPEDIYDVLASVVMPSESQAIFLYVAPMSMSRDAPISEQSSVAKVLTKFAGEQANHLAELLDLRAVENRDNLIKARVIQTMLWVQRQELAKAKVVMTDLNRLSQEDLSTRASKWISHAVGAALTWPELEEAAIEIAISIAPQLRGVGGALASKIENLMVQNHVVDGQRLDAFQVVDRLVKEQLLSSKTPFEYHAKNALARLIDRSLQVKEADTAVYGYRRYCEFVRRYPQRISNFEFSIEELNQLLMAQPKEKQLQLATVLCLPFETDRNIYVPLFVDQQAFPDVPKSGRSIDCLAGLPLRGPFATFLNAVNREKAMLPMLAKLRQAAESGVRGADTAFIVAQVHCRNASVEVNWSKFDDADLNERTIEGMLRAVKKRKSQKTISQEPVDPGIYAAALALAILVPKDPKVTELLNLLSEQVGEISEQQDGLGWAMEKVKVRSSSK